MLTIIFPCTLKSINIEQITGERQLLIDLFRENCAKKRQLFFEDPLIRYLWNNIFMRDNPDLITDTLRQIKSDKRKGDLGVEKYVESMQYLQKKFRINFLPKNFTADKVKIFKPEEEYQYLLNYGKYNKR